jgi:hypothetical protein
MEAVKVMQYRPAQPLALPIRRLIMLVMKAVKDMQYCPAQQGLLASKLQSALKTTRGVPLYGMSAL